MSNRINLRKSHPAAFKAMLAFDAFSETTVLSAMQQDLIKIRASQLNGCAYCIDMHTKEARAHGETEQRIYALSAWKETPFFSKEERSILALTEEVTLIGNRVSDETYARAAELFDEKYLSEILIAIVIINAWNRIGVATNLMPVMDKAAALSFDW